MEKTPGRDPRSGKKIRKRNRKKPKAKKRREQKLQQGPKPNGKTDWKEMAKASQEQVKSLEQTLASQMKKYRDLVTRFKLVEKAGIDERAAVKLRILQHMWSQMINFQAKCPEDKEKVNKLVAEYGPAMKEAVAEASKPL